MDFKKALQDEIFGLEASLKAQPDPRLVKLHELRRVLAIYNGEAPALASSPASRVSIEEEGKPARRGRTPDPMRQAAIDEAREILSSALGPMRTGEIYKRLERRGITLGGTLPANNLSALLYHHPDFVSHGRTGWTLKSSDGEPSENEKPADPVSEGEQSAGLSQPSAQGGEPGREVEHDNIIS
ncbi:winged helix-turn-helix domain-containing protein [Mesorhizobium sp. Mes31]|uniref:winged helix-turn-helix domain-containing protein n=1 Tax=Mesorhizobium sp. Mes31 TaxID=2926017 RepID=UPI002118CD06|nr:winged helix-turn-helix domain-containing protein [Mesorhizobium sp. Mes31]